MRGAFLTFCRTCLAQAFWTVLPGEPSAAWADEQADGVTPYDRPLEQIDRDHWADQPVRDVRVPHVDDAGWARNPVDNFILARLEERGWRPAAPVDRRILLRRVWLDLVGLTPDPSQQQRFLNDTSPDAYERSVDSLLARPGYGERWGRHWFGLVRFAQTNGTERDANVIERAIA